jgi:hypothetical protein
MGRQAMTGDVGRGVHSHRHPRCRDARRWECTCRVPGRWNGFAGVRSPSDDEPQEERAAAAIRMGPLTVGPLGPLMGPLTAPTSMQTMG